MAVRFAIDTNCIVAAVCDWHGHHRAAAAEIERRLDRGEQMTVAAHALVEAYSVLTRFPAPHRLTPTDAWTVLHASFCEAGGGIALTAPQHVRFLDRLASTGIAGGRTYDALI